jgi:hypothetical protein
MNCTTASGDMPDALITGLDAGGLCGKSQTRFDTAQSASSSQDALRRAAGVRFLSATICFITRPSAIAIPPHRSQARIVPWRRGERDGVPMVPR